MTTIELNNREAKLFIEFLKYRDLWDKVFKIKNGSVTIHLEDFILKKAEYKQFDDIKIYLKHANTCV